VLIPFTSAVGRDAVQEAGDLDAFMFEQTQEKPSKLPAKKKPNRGILLQLFMKRYLTKKILLKT